MVLHYLLDGVDVAVDAGTQQGEHWLVVVELRDLPEDHVVDILVHGGGLARHRRRDVGCQLADFGTIHVHLRILTHSAVLAHWQRCRSSATNCRPRLYASTVHPPREADSTLVLGKALRRRLRWPGCAPA